MRKRFCVCMCVCVCLFVVWQRHKENTQSWQKTQIEEEKNRKIKRC